MNGASGLHHQIIHSKDVAKHYDDVFGGRQNWVNHSANYIPEVANEFFKNNPKQSSMATHFAAQRGLKRAEEAKANGGDPLAGYQRGYTDFLSYGWKDDPEYARFRK